MQGDKHSVPGMGDLPGMAKRVRLSPLFDPEWYVGRYPDVAALGMDAAEHFVLIGCSLGRRPGPNFDPEAYVRANPDVAASGVSPFFHLLGKQDHFRKRFKGYIDKVSESGVSGWAVDHEHPDAPVPLQMFIDGRLVAEFKTTRPRQDVAASGIRASCAGYEYAWRPGAIKAVAEIDVRIKESGESLTRSPKTLHAGAHSLHEMRYIDMHRSGQVRRVCIVVPVFNAYEAVEECLVSLVAHCPAYASVLVVNDGSTDDRIPGMLARFGEDSRFTIVDNGVNLGYTRTINKAISMCAEKDVVLLNSDTKVTSRWLDNLRFCAYADPRNGTVTALSNNAGAFSVPVIGQCNDAPERFDDDQFAAAVTYTGFGIPIEVPTANGFCMYIRRDLLDAIGAFDEAKYPRGYGEENDLSMRALRAGWKNIVCDKAFVLHKRSQSFKEEKQVLIHEGSEQLRKDYPEYKGLTGRFRDVEFTLLRNRIADALDAKPAGFTLPRILFVVSTQTGGTPQTNMDLMRSLDGRYNCFLLRSDAKRIFLSELVDGELVEREALTLDRRIEPETHVSGEYDSIVSGLMYRYSISLLHIRHLLWHGLGLPEVAQAMNIPVIYSFHDFYSICASHNLLDNNLRYCGGTCTDGSGECPTNLWPNGAPANLKHGFVHHWRAMFARVYGHCDRFVTTAPSGARILADNYPQLDGRITVIPHGRDFDHFLDLAAAPQAGSKLRVLIPGNIGPSKGSGLIREMEGQNGGRSVEFHLLGALSRELAGIGVQHGTYDRSGFASFVEKIRPSVGMILSIWPETYCHTLTEMWACGMPVLAMDIGAVGDRIRASGGGWLIPVDATPEQILVTLDGIARDSTGYEQRRQAVLDWQREEGKVNSIMAMSTKYQSIYDSILIGQVATEKSTHT